MKPYDYAVSWIDSLKEQGYHVYLLSNYPRDIFTLHANVGSFPFLDHVDGKIVSGFVQMIKPDADIYEKLIEIDYKGTLAVEGNIQNSLLFDIEASAAYLHNTCRNLSLPSPNHFDISLKMD